MLICFQTEMKQQSCFLALRSSCGDYSANKSVFSLPGAYLAFFLLLTDYIASCSGFQAVRGSSLQLDLVCLCRKGSSGDSLISKHHKPFIQTPLILSLDDRYVIYYPTFSAITVATGSYFPFQKGLTYTF